jgi:hypothetical protein
MKSNNLIHIALVTTGILLVPAIGMQFSGEWNWDTTDFIVMGALIFSTGLIFNLAMQKVRSNTHKIVVGTTIVAIFLYIWAELAVGIFTNWGS